MSLESYKKTISDQQQSFGRYTEEPISSESDLNMQKERSSDIEFQPRTRRKKTGKSKMIICVIIIAVLFLAALKNPSKSEAKVELKSLITEKFNEKMRDNITDEDQDALSQIGSGLAMLLAPTLIDKMVETNISNYLFFSTFSAKITFEKNTKTIVSGIILFGNFIPLNSDLKNKL